MHSLYMFVCIHNFKCVRVCVCVRGVVLEGRTGAEGYFSESTL